MNPTDRRSRGFASFMIFLALATVAHAHPGHEGHELTWDFSHLARHPLATVGCAAVLGAGIWALVQLFRRRAELRGHTLRGSQPSRAK